MIKFSIVITTKNRIEDLKITLESLKSTLLREDVELIVCDDASNDGTIEYLQQNCNHRCYFNPISKGYLFNRNLLNNEAKGKYIISLDDDANFLGENFLENIEDCFVNNSNCGAIALRVFWGKDKPINTYDNSVTQQVNSFVGCGHVWRKDVWKQFGNYPEWYQFYGEEDFASKKLFKLGYSVVYLPSVLVHHRVDMKARKKNKDYYIRYRRSLRAGWYNLLTFYPYKVLPRFFFYTLWVQIKNKTFKGDFKATYAIIFAFIDTLKNCTKLFNSKNRFSFEQFLEYKSLKPCETYWKPKLK